MEGRRREEEERSGKMRGRMTERGSRIGENRREEGKGEKWKEERK